MPHIVTERAGNIRATTCERQPQPQIKISFEKTASQCVHRYQMATTPRTTLSA
ncbi:hypothetical protein HMPREF6745_0176 [Prevotella sp. oral taxon 472 str. F0295]|nr:hypothetical protein HMPREF6745_0176 [Prevotella sp. oral taxon 472 str. F0295]